MSTALAERVCRAHGLGLEVLWRGARLVVLPGKEPLRYVIRGDHAYGLTKPQKASRAPRSIPETAIAQDFEQAGQKSTQVATPIKTEVDMNVLRTRTVQLEAGRTYRASNLDGLREQLHRQGVVPDCRLAGPNKIVELSVPVWARAWPPSCCGRTPRSARPSARPCPRGWAGPSRTRASPPSSLASEP